MLEDFASDDTIVDRVTLLHSSSVGKEFKKLPFRSTEMNTIFRVTMPKAIDSVEAVKSRKRGRGSDGDTSPGSKPKRGRPMVRNSDRNPSVVCRNWTDRTIWVNAASQRVDSRLPELPQAMPDCWLQTVKAAKTRACRAFHMNDNCRGACGYSHSPLSDEVRLALRKSLREQVCHVGLSCRDPSCYYGHNCSCKRTKCDFLQEMHGVDEATAEVWNPRVEKRPPECMDILLSPLQSVLDRHP